MRLRHLHPWDLTPGEAAALQTRLAPMVIREGDVANVRLVAAADVAFATVPGGGPKAVARAAVVVLAYPGLTVVEQQTVETPVAFPYVPGLLSFRELPALAGALEATKHEPGLLLVDGQGYAHPRRFGLACHIGVLLDVPAIGCAKSRLCGEQGALGLEAGSRAPLVDGGEVIGLALRTRTGAAPVYVSVGHRISLEAAAEWVLRLCRGRRIPEPLRLADRLSKGRGAPTAGA